MFATKCLLNVGADECDNLSFVNFKTDSFKIPKNSWIFFLKFLVKFDFSIYGYNFALVKSIGAGATELAGPRVLQIFDSKGTAAQHEFIG